MVYTGVGAAHGFDAPRLCLQLEPTAVRDLDRAVASRRLFIQTAMPAIAVPDGAVR